MVEEVWRYPVKSMQGEALPAATATARGLLGDRAFAILDRQTGKVASAKHARRWGALLACRARLIAGADDENPAVRIALPDGRAVFSDRAGCDDALSAALGRAVALVSRPPAGAEIEREWPDVEGMALRSGVTSGPIGVGVAGPSFFDHGAIHLLTTASLARLRSRYPAGDFAARRFRPNLLLALPPAESGFVENGWVGRRLRIGDEVILRVTDPTPRCAVPTLPQPDLPGDVDILRAVARHNRPPIPALGGATLPSLGVYATVERGGTIRRGDRATVVEDA